MVTMIPSSTKYSALRIAATAIFSLAIVLAAFLSFVIQPLVGKALLPTYGGSATVWLVCLFFFQTALLLGYLYAACLQKLSIGIQIGVHSFLLALSALAVPLALHQVAQGDITSSVDPVLILRSIFLLCGVPFIALTTTSPLMQSWIVKCGVGNYPYWLYGVSNLASCLGLLSYPFWMEGHLGIKNQAYWWGNLYGVFVFICLVLAVVVWCVGSRLNASEPKSGFTTATGDYLPWGHWLLCSFVASALLLGVTNVLCRDLAAIPLLWIIPLAIYLITFAFSFAFTIFLLILVPCLVAALLFTFFHTDLGLPGIFWTLVGAFFAYGSAAWICAGELARTKPNSAYLTTFYLVVAVGGALGSFVVALVAPVIFSDYSEFVLALTLFCIVTVRAILRRQLPISTGQQIKYLGSTLAVSLLVTVTISRFVRGNDMIFQDRSFYGTLKVTCVHCDSVEHAEYVFSHGSTIHGAQFRVPHLQSLATTYYGKGSGIERVLSYLRRIEPMRVGVVGLGVGTIATYGQIGDVYRFYEIDPEVTKVARNFFSFLSGTHAAVEVVHGDGRLLLAQELVSAKPGKFDVLMLDAFSSDSIPNHLITLEAIEIYLQHLSSRGVIVVHVSNRFLDLAPLLALQARELNLIAAQFTDGAANKFNSSYVVLSRVDEHSLKDFLSLGATPIESKRFSAPWTDDFSNTLDLVRGG